MSSKSDLESIARAAYDIGFGAKKHFATFDAVEKLPGWVGFISFSIGVFALIHEPLAKKFVSATLVVAGMSVIYLAVYRSADYEKAGKALTDIYHELAALHTQAMNGGFRGSISDKVSECRRRAQDVSISRQLFLADWWAHYKFFGQQQTGWIEAELGLTWRDKWPASLRFTMSAAAISAIAAAAYYWSS
ncbi:SLATT domain-containing protein [Porphyrobacter sp. CACIAM 03H1]|uniref:SLATT domain-containing protein n=1 Tax=Porphyrobacter sp. CACIAM 03H1 TaxID=2003315 RepID=UPI0012FD66BE|nr:SLATT domain-containing protein [Porphyrobacter sp. CACIAM 03H1]